MSEWTGSGLRFFDQPELAEVIMRVEAHISPDPWRVCKALVNRGVVPQRGCHPSLKRAWLAMFAAEFRRTPLEQRDHMLSRREDCEAAYGGRAP